MKLPVKEESEPVVVAQGKITNFGLFAIANSNGQTLPNDNQVFGLRFRLINSFKAKDSNKVVNQFVWEVITNGAKGIIGKKEVERVKILVQQPSEQKKLLEKEEPKKLIVEDKEEI